MEFRFCCLVAPTPPSHFASWHLNLALNLMETFIVKLLDYTPKNQFAETDETFRNAEA